MPNSSTEPSYFCFTNVSTSCGMLVSMSSTVCFGVHPIDRARFPRAREFVPHPKPLCSLPKYLTSSSLVNGVGSGSVEIPSRTSVSPMALLIWYQLCSPFSPK